MDALFVIVAVIAAVGAVIKFFRTKDLSSKLGREVADHELISLNSWLEAEKKAEEKRTAFKHKIVNYEIADRTEAAPASGEQTPPIADAPDTPISAAVEGIAAPEKRPNHCPNCGAVLSKELAYCRFCNTHVSQREVEQHCAVFLFDTQEDLISRTPPRYRLLKTSAWLVPLVVFVALISSNIFVKQLFNPCAMLTSAAAIAFAVRFALNYLTESYLTKTDTAHFDVLYASQIKRFIARYRLQNIEFLSIARCHLEKDSRLLKQIHRYF